MADIFFSYSTHNRRKVKVLIDILNNCGWTVWWDQSIAAGEEWSDEILKELNNAKCVIIAWSRKSINSEWVLREATIALEKDKFLPVLLEPVNVPFDFAHIQAERLTAWDGVEQTHNVTKFIRAVAKKLGNNPPGISRVDFEAVVDEIERIEAAEAAVEYCAALFASVKDRNEITMDRVQTAYERLRNALSPITDEDLHDFLERYFEELV